jgi:FtsH-binding integral membrane protein
MFRLGQQLSNAAPRLARSGEKKLEQANHHTPVQLTPQSLEKLALAVRRIHTAKVSTVAHAKPATPTPAALAPLPKSHVIVTPFMKHHTAHHIPARSFSTFRIETWKPEHATPMHTKTPTTTVIPPLSTRGLSSFLRHVYLATGLSVSGAIAASYVIAALSLIPSAAAVPVWMGSIVTIMGSAWALNKTAPETVSHSIDPQNMYTVNKWHRKLAFGALLASSAIALTPVMTHLSLVSPWFVPITLTASALSFVGASAVTRWRESKGAALQWQSPLGGALLAGGALGTIGAGTFILLGSNGLSAVLLTTQPYIAVALFGALIAADSRAAVTEYRAGQADHLVHAITFHRNAFNLMLETLRVNFRRALL